MSEGKINESILMMREELIKRKNRKDLSGRIGAIGMCIGILPLGILFFIQDTNLIRLTYLFANPLLWISLIVVIFSYGYYSAFYKKAKDKYDNLKDELREKIWIEFCSCWSVCNHKEEFLKETKEKYGINLYWK